MVESTSPAGNGLGDSRQEGKPFRKGRIMIRNVRSAYTCLDVLVGLMATCTVVALLLPAAVKATGPADICLANAGGLAQSLLTYAAAHASVMPGDDRCPQAAADPVQDVLRGIPLSQDQFDASWLAKLNSEATVDTQALDCPLASDQRRGEWWPTDYVINRWAIHTATDVAADPDKAVLVGEPNMQRSTLLFLAESIGWSDWGTRTDLEQNQVGSLSFAFVDGHAVRVQVAAGDEPHLANYAEIFMAQPAAEPYERNYLWWTTAQSLPNGQ